MAATQNKPPAAKPPASRKNRDQERLYRPGVLSFWFAVTSIVLVIGWVLMFWKDYARPWKDYQRAYYDMLIEYEEDQLNEKTASVGDDERELLLTLNADLEKARADLAAQAGKLEELEDKRVRIKNDLKLADNEFKGVKGLHAVARYQFEEARQHLRRMQREHKIGPEIDTMPERSKGEIEDARKSMDAKARQFNRFSHRIHPAKIAYENLLVDLQNVEAELASLQAPVRRAEAELAKKSIEIDVQQNKLEGYKTKYARNQWRNAPIIDFISPTIKIEKIVVDDIHDDWNFATSPKVDYCITCHLGTDLPDLGRPEVIEKYNLTAERRYMRAHPHLDFMVGSESPHPQKDLACTTCHHGVGRAIHFARSSHFPEDMKTKERWIEQHGWYKAKYIDYPMFPLQYVQGQCFKCHKDGMVYPVPYKETLDHGFVAEKIDKKDRELSVYGQRQDPEGPLDDSNPLLPPNRVYGAYKLPNAPAPVWGNVEDVAQGTAAFLAEHYGEDGTSLTEMLTPEAFDKWVGSQVESYGWFAEGFDRGYENTTGYGCIGCHKIEDAGTQVGYEAPPRVAPTLTYLKDKVDQAWLEKWIRYPNRYRADTLMPSFYEFALKDDEWNHIRLPGDGEGPGPVATMSIIDAHLLDPKFQSLGKISTYEDAVRADVEILAMSTYLMNLQDRTNGKPFSRAGTDDPLYAAVGEGRIDKGRELVNTLGCAACHLLPEYKQGEDYVEDSLERFDFQPPLGRGPRLTNLGSKIKSREWLAAWLKRPRHYTHTTRMPNMRIPEDDIPHIVDYLLSFRDDEFDSLPRTMWRKSEQYTDLLADMYEQFYGKKAGGGTKRPTRVEGEVGDLNDASNRARVLYMVGAKIMSRNGCFGCHEVSGHENEQPIGAELSKYGQKDIHQLDFGRVPKYAKVKVPVVGADGKPERDADGNIKTTWEKQRLIGHTRQEFYRNKVTHPRIYDYGKQLRWTDRTRMPLFNFPNDDSQHEDGLARRDAVAGFILGQVKEKIHETAKFHPDEYEKDLRDGRRVVKRYGCNQCHTIEGQMGYYYGLKAGQLPYLDGTEWAGGEELATLPPNLFTQGLRTQSGWLVNFLDEPEFLRPIVAAHMPRFELSDAELQALVKYFIRLAGRDQDMVIPMPGSTLAKRSYLGQEGVGDDGYELVEAGTEKSRGRVANALDEAEKLFELINCNSCHLPKGFGGAGEADGGVAPSFRHAGKRLRHEWVRVLLDNPTHLIFGTKMPSVYGMKRTGSRTVDQPFQTFQFELRWDPAWQERYKNPDTRDEALTELAELQMDALTQYLLYHYEPSPDEPPMRKPVETFPKDGK